jgi:hypothetical protein
MIFRFGNHTAKQKIDEEIDLLKQGLSVYMPEARINVHTALGIVY